MTRTTWIVAGIGLGALLAGIAVRRSNSAEPAGESVAEVASAPVAGPVVTVDPALRAKVPAPTELAAGMEDVERHHHARKDWIKSLHRAPPDVDWKAVERANGRAQITKRNLLAAAPPPASGPRWVERGSNNQAGRMHVGRPSTDGKRVYAGSSAGGVWTGNLDGSGWRPIGDNLYGGAHHLLTLPPATAGDPDVLLVANDGGFVHRSADEGLTWEAPAGLPDLRQVRRLVRTTDGSEVVLLVGAPSGGNRRNLYRSTDGGRTFAEVYDFGTYEGDVWVPRNGGAGAWLVDDDVVYRSDDAGLTWTEVGDIAAGGDRAELVGSEAGAPRLWAAVSSRGSTLYRSDDAGASWQSVTSMSDYWGELEASITSVDVAAWGGVELHVTRDAARFTELNGWEEYYGREADKLHADMMGLVVVPDGEGERWYIGCDGGLYASDDALSTVRNLSLSGLRVGQYYGTLTSAVDPSHIALGAQDQGYQLTTGVAQDDAVYEFDQAISGDYGHLTSGDGTHGHVFSVYPGFVLVQIGEDAPELRYVDFPPSERYNWLPVVLADPLDPTAFFFGASKLYRYEKRARSQWEAVVHSEQDFSGGGDDFIAAMAFSPVDPNRMWVATYQGGMWASSDHGVTWARSEDGVPGGQYFYGQALTGSRTSADVVYVGGSGYGNPAVYRSTDGGVTWEEYADGLPDTLVYALVEAPDGSGILFAGTETSAWRRDPGSEAWVDITAASAPVTVYWSAEALAFENTIRFGTYGRGVWDYQLEPDDTACFPVVDADGDGVDCATDCDDGDPTIAPGLADDCDGVDRDCDPTRPIEGDADGDGHWACADCDDGNAEVFPGAGEQCGDRIDQDCDGADETCPTVDDAGKDDGCGGCGTTGGTGGGAAGGAGILAAILLARRRSASARGSAGRSAGRPG